MDSETDGLVSIVVFAKRLKAEREKRKAKDPKWTQGYVADLIGVARPTYTAYEAGTKQPPMETVSKLADLFNVSTDYLHGKTNDPSPIGKTEASDKLVNVFFREWDKADEEKRKRTLEFLKFLNQMADEENNKN
ncbi:helix-turn-helix domain-containing protein [Brevibacillus sp. H7]|uniref:helix-turn-helix domain-containing protein n=1 Tax=Brevibacillus sp. H7 TaxID=3349138 RepID=UPI00381F8768